MFKLPGATSDPKSHRDNSSCIAVGIYKKCFGFNSFEYENECSVMIWKRLVKISYRFRTAVQPNHMQLFAAFLEFEYEILNCGFRKLFENHMTIIWFRAQVQQSLTPFYKTSFASSIKECFCLSRSWNVTPHLAGVT